MIYPPGFDPALSYQEIEYNGRVIVCYSGDALPLMFDSHVMRALAAVEPMSEEVWFATLQPTPAEPMTNPN